MSAFEVERYIFTGTLVLSFLIKSAKWTVEEAIDLIALCKKLRTTLTTKHLTEMPGLTRSPTASQQPMAISQPDSKAA